MWNIDRVNIKEMVLQSPALFTQMYDIKSGQKMFFFKFKKYVYTEK